MRQIGVRPLAALGKLAEQTARTLAALTATADNISPAAAGNARACHSSSNGCIVLYHLGADVAENPALTSEMML